MQPSQRPIPPDPVQPGAAPARPGPGIAAFLLSGGKVTDEVFTRTLLSLAESGWLRIEARDPGVPTVRIVQQPTAFQVRRYEHTAMERVTRRTGNTPNVPLSALTSNEGADYEPWRKRFAEAVRAEAREQGLLAGGVLSKRSLLVPLTVALAAAIATWVEGGHVAKAAFIAGIAGLVLTLFAMGLIFRARLTDAGRAAADRLRAEAGAPGGASPAGAATMPNAASAEALIAQGAAPLPSGHVWSSYGGTWHTVEVGKLDATRWGKPSAAMVPFAAGAVFVFVLVLIGRALGGTAGTLLAAVPLALFGGLLLLGWLPAVLRRLSVPTHAELSGQVVKRWSYESGGDDSRKTHYCLCIDDGASPKAWAFRIEPSLYQRLRVGDTVAVEFNPRWHTVEQIDVVESAPGAR